ncbi:hypothetical protein ACOMHN_062774 [Nucella lapillus]
MAASSVVHEIAPIPNRTISCQDLLKDEICVYSGWLRRQSLRNKLKIFAWPHVYVAIAGGCVYCYGSEVSRRPASAFSLYGYDRVFRAGEITEREATWTFKLVHVNSAYRSYLFSSSSQREMTQWMYHIRQEMLRASGKLPKGVTRPSGTRTPADGSSWEAPGYQDAGSGSAGSITSQELREIEDSIYEDTSHFVLPANYSNKKEEDNSDEEMDRVVQSRPDLQDRPPIPPPVPRRPNLKKLNAASQGIVQELKNLNIGGEKLKSTTPELAKPPQDSGRPAVDRTSKPILLRGDPDGSSAQREEEPVDAKEYWSSIYFYGGKEKAHEVITKIADEGVFLVRVNEDKSMVLHVYGKDQARKFIIFKHENKYALDKTSPQFARVDDLVYHYYDHPLPRVDVCLVECYLYHPVYHSLDWS